MATRNALVEGGKGTIVLEKQKRKKKPYYA